MTKKHEDGLSFDTHNANKGTARGRKMVKDSLEAHGAGRSILVDKNGVAIAGNKTLEAARSAKMPVRIIETDGKELVVVKRTDLDLKKDAKAKALGVADNRAGEAGLLWDTDVLEVLGKDFDMSTMFTAEELKNLPGIDEAPVSTKKKDVAARNDFLTNRYLVVAFRTNEAFNEACDAFQIQNMIFLADTGTTKKELSRVGSLGPCIDGSMLASKFKKVKK